MIDSTTAIQMVNKKLIVPDQVTIPFITGDGIGPDVTDAMQSVVNAAIEKAYQFEKKIIWNEVFAGEKAFHQTGEWLPQETLNAFSEFVVGIKGPLTTPVGGGIRSLNVALRKDLDLYVCLRPVRYFQGINAPVTQPEKIDVTIFRENTEDVYSGIEFESDSQEAKMFLDWLQEQLPDSYHKIRFPQSVGLGIKPISKEGSQRLIQAAIEYAIRNKKPIVTLIHKGNIMKFTEGAFRMWGYDLAERDYKEFIYTARQFEHTRTHVGISEAKKEKEWALGNGMIWMNDVITDAAFQNLLLYPQDFSVIASSNLNGDYLSDALAAQVGGIGISPGANINYQTGIAVFEATHGTAPDIAGKNLANPSSLILSSVLMLQYLGWNDAAELITKALEKTINHGQLTQDLAQFVTGSSTLGTGEFAKAIINNF
ncbi:MAG: NADP-dependent isocitrate dehydrogenase [Chloroflexi bacterium HGW-Chloroflexi-2]|jgi:isocitrate dehydrogenase|nr:MAG: NADP-dependent isocitrate dehydrogenase [Chloroflexi bacterium HGW-Chloroflexi-2]